MYDVARPALLRLTGLAPAALEAFYAELPPLHAALRQEVGRRPSAGALVQAPLLYLLVRALRPRWVVETGISSGYSARLILEALARNGAGHLDSIGVDVFGMRKDRGAPDLAEAGLHVGWLVPDRLAPWWTLHLGTSQERLPPLLAAGRGPLDLFLHDSLHQYPTMSWEYATAFPALGPGALLASHDVHANAAWADFLAGHALAHDEELDHDLGVVRLPAPSPAG